MSIQYFQVVGRTPWMIDLPTGDSFSYRPGQIFESNQTNSSVQRGLRMRALRELDAREATALRNVEVVRLKGLNKAAEAAVAEAKAKAEPPKPAEPVKLKPGKPESK